MQSANLVGFRLGESKIYTEQNEFYEKRFALEKTAALSRKKKQSVTRKLPIDEEQVSETVHESCPLQEQVLPVQDGHGSIPSSEVVIDHENNMSLKNLPQKALSEHNSEKVAVKYMQTKKLETKEKVEVKTIENSKHEEITKGKIAIKLTGKTVIKPHDKILPVWTPLAIKSEVTLPKKFKEVKTSVMSVAKPEISNPPSLDSFLSIGGLATKKLPVYKLRPGVFRKPLSLLSDPVVSYGTHKTTAQEEEADMKLLGIDSDMTNEIALKRKPPPRSQNVSLPKHISSKSSSSAEQLYSVFFQDGGHVNERSCQPVDLDDIPIPPPPPLPPSSICHATTSNTSESLHTKGQKDEAGDCVATKLEENISNMKDRKEKDNTFINMANLLQFCSRMPPDMTELGDKTTEKEIDEERNEGNKSLTINDVSLRQEAWLLPEQMTLHDTETEDEEIIYVESDFEVVDEYNAE